MVRGEIYRFKKYRIKDTAKPVEKEEGIWVYYDKKRGRLQKFDTQSQNEIENQIKENSNSTEFVLQEIQKKFVLNFSDLSCKYEENKSTKKTEFFKVYQDPIWCCLNQNKNWEFKKEINQRLELSFKDGKPNCSHDLDRIKYLFDFKSFVYLKKVNSDPSSALKLIRLPPIYEMVCNTILFAQELEEEIEQGDSLTKIQLSQQEFEKIKKNDKIRFGKAYFFLFL